MSSDIKITVENDHNVYINGNRAPYQQAKNVQGVIKPEWLVLHDTASPLTPSGDIDWLTRSAKDASVQMFVDRNGTLTQFAQMNRKCWHAGVSKWNGRANCNDFTVGIEIDNPGKMVKVGNGIYRSLGTIDTNKPAPFGPPDLRVVEMSTPQHGSGYWLDYTDNQIAAVTMWCRAMVARYPSIKGIVTHWLISPGRKVDTNPLFPLEQVRQAVFGNKSPPKVTEEQAKKVAEAFIPDATVTVNDLNMRRQPSMSADVIGKLKSGQRIDVQEASGDWLFIKTPAGYKGYVYSKMVQLD